MANLWDVTDMDIDRFSRALLKQWLAQCDAPDPSEAASDGGGGAAEPGDDGSHCGACVGLTVAQSRAACRLRHLIGAAPVCWGVPLLVHRRPSNYA